MERIICLSGRKGWRSPLRDQYTGLAEFVACAEMWGLHTRLGFETPEEAWAANPTVEGSTKPEDYRAVPDAVLTVLASV